MCDVCIWILELLCEHDTKFSHWLWIWLWIFMHEKCELMNIWVTTLRNEMEYELWHENYEMKWKWYDMRNVMCCIIWNEMNVNARIWNEMEMKWNGNEMNVNARHYEKYDMICAVWNGMQRMCMQEYEMKMRMQDIMRNMKVMCCMKWNVNDMYCMKWNVKMWMQEYERKWKIRNECKCKTVWEMWDVMSCMKWNVNMKHMKYEMAVWLMCMYEMCDRTKNENECLALW